jgi:hypothetical protein
MADCSAVHDPEHRYEDGWRLGRISRIGSELPAPGTRANDCRLEASSPHQPSARYAEVWYVRIRRLRYYTVRLPEEGVFHDGDYVYINVHDCSLSAES